MLDQRAVALLHVLKKYGPQRIKRLEKELGCTRRQITYDVKKINDWLINQGIPPIKNDRSKGLTIPSRWKEQVEERVPVVKTHTYIASPMERKGLILLKVFTNTEYVSVNHLISLLKVSKNTVLTSIKEASKLAEQHHVIIKYTRRHGYELAGEEGDVRFLMMHCISEFIRYEEGSKLLKNLYNQENGQGAYEHSHKKITALITEMEKQLDIKYVEEKVQEVIVFLLFLLLRIQKGGSIFYSDDRREIIANLNEYKVISEKVTQLGIPKETDEQLYVTSILIGLQCKDGHLNKATFLMERQLYALTQVIIQEFELLACVSISNQKELAHSLYYHIRPAYYRMLFHIPIVNPLLKQIKEEFPDLFVLVKKALKPLEEFVKRPISEEEAGYITLHFGTYVDTTNIHVDLRKKAVIVCPNGVGTSNMLKYQIEKLLPEVEILAIYSLSDYDYQRENEFDLLFSTVPFQTAKPIIMVNPILTGLDKARILQEFDFHVLRKKDLKGVSVNQIMEVIKLYTTIHDENRLYETLGDLVMGHTAAQFRGYKPVISDLLKREMIQIKDKVDSWQEAIRVAASPLLSIQAIEPRYIDAMITNIEKLGSYVVLAPNVAIPHARPEDGVKKLSMSLLKLNEPISFTADDPHKNVQLIFVLAAVDNHSHLKALSQLTELLEEEENIELMIEMTATESFLELIQSYSEI
ncbi:BglG family transcription antiterminator [Niallia circulans]|uniref:BglG family transcription antiterminator n=1 Tax=Niallia circulans TaxID=1397 RepID=UPI00148F9308|nr:BglG family transcription antiterminator [Niallia circulans]QJX64140.1 BglG family transcription antiterminator [Niallia circulans]